MARHGMFRVVPFTFSVEKVRQFSFELSLEGLSRICILVGYQFTNQHGKILFMWRRWLLLCVSTSRWQEHFFAPLWLCYYLGECGQQWPGCPRHNWPGCPGHYYYNPAKPPAFVAARLIFKEQTELLSLHKKAWWHVALILLWKILRLSEVHNAIELVKVA